MRMNNYTGSGGYRLTAWKTDSVGDHITVLVHKGGSNRWDMCTDTNN